MSGLDRLLDAAREAEPEALGEAATDALVRNARRGAARRPVQGAPTQRVLEEARRAEPEPLTERALRSMAQRAALTGRARHGRWTRRRVMATSALAATLAAAAVTMILAAPAAVDPSRATVATPAPRDTLATRPDARDPDALRPDEPGQEPTDLDLPTGDRLVAASGARFHVELPEPRVRRVRLGGGSMLFDVRPIERGRFSVSTPSAQIVVLGTVFSVQATERATTVWVYEGAVRVEGPNGMRLVTAGGVLHLGAGEAGADQLAVAGRDAAARRAPSAVDASSTSVPGAAASGAAASSASGAAASSASGAGAPSTAASSVVASTNARDDSPDPAPAPATHEPSAPATTEAARPTAAEARGLIAGGDAPRALATAEDAIARGEIDPWRMLEGDALRVLGRFEHAAAAYQRAARELPAPRRQQAGFLEARVRMAELRDPSGALRALRSAEVTASDSVLRERGMALEVGLLARLGRRAEAAAVAGTYVRDYPEGPDAETMRAHASSGSASEDLTDEL